MTIAPAFSRATGVRDRRDIGSGGGLNADSAWTWERIVLVGLNEEKIRREALRLLEKISDM